MKVIDADGHVVEKDRDIRAYLPQPHCDRHGRTYKRNTSSEASGANAWNTSLSAARTICGACCRHIRATILTVERI